MGDETASLRRRIERSGLRVLPPAAPLAPNRATVLEHRRGEGTAITDALACGLDTLSLFAAIIDAALTITDGGDPAATRAQVELTLYLLSARVLAQMRQCLTRV